MTEEKYIQSVTEMQTKLYHTARAILWNDQDAADAVQDAMLRGWRCRWMLRSEEQFGAWFMRILVNRCRDIQRKRMRDKGLMEEMLRQEQLKQRRAEGGAAFDALTALPEALRLPALLYYYQVYGRQ